MALYATNRFPGDGVTTTYEINFVGKYLDRSHVFAYVEDDVTKDRTSVTINQNQWLNDTTLQWFAPTPVGSTLVIYRNTPAAPLVDFVSGAWLTPNALNTATRQGLFKAVESSDAGGDGGGPVSWADIQGKPYASSLVPGIVKVGSGLAISPSGVLSATGGGGGGSSTPTGPAGGVLSGAYPNPGFAQDMATQAELDAVASASTLGLSEKAPILHGHLLSELNPSGAVLGQVPTWNGSAWVPQTPAAGGGGGGAPTGPAGGVLAGAYPNPTFAQEVATREQLYMLSQEITGLAKADGSNASGKWNNNANGVASLAGIPQGGATANQVLTWNGSAWVPQTPAAGGGGGGSLVNAIAFGMSATTSISATLKRVLVNDAGFVSQDASVISMPLAGLWSIVTPAGRFRWITVTFSLVFTTGSAIEPVVYLRVASADIPLASAYFHYSATLPNVLQGSFTGRVAAGTTSVELVVGARSGATGNITDASVSFVVQPATLS